MADLNMVVPLDNPITDAKVALGRRLFFDPLLSATRSVSCATCHEPERAFADARPIAVGVFGRLGTRHSPALINRGFGRTHFWDGRASALEAQVLMPIADPNEMDVAIEDAVKRVAADATYRAAFADVFGGPVTAADLARALATFIRTIRSADSPYDRFVASPADALPAEALTGLRLFRGRARCSFCHIEPTFTDEQFHNTGISWRDADSSFQDEGRMAVSRLARDRGAFKTPTLREIARTAPYMHDGSLKTLAEVIDFYAAGGRQNPNLSRLIRPIALTAAEKQSLVAFLESLSGVVTGK
jgi:cytochrome c peroxidase